MRTLGFTFLFAFTASLLLAAFPDGAAAQKCEMKSNGGRGNKVVCK